MLQREIAPARAGILVRIGFFAWAGLLLLIVATLMVGHWLTLPTPDLRDKRLVHELNALRTDSEKTSWLGVHVLYTECRCSQRIFEHLFTSERPSDVVEKVLLVGASPALEERARRAGFDLVVVTPTQLNKQFAIEAAPLLLVVNPEGEVAYAGGYTERKQGPEIQDLAVFRDLLAEREQSTLPLYGCGVSKALQGALDPLGIKY